MYNVIVVDDETWICKLIRKIVNWETLGFRIIACAGDGLDALNLIQEHKPDLVITDIRMPGLDGIGLIKEMREHKLDTEVIIISGYSDFEYARSAISFDTFGYLLKPLDKDEFEDILLRIKEKIGKKHNIRNKLETSETVMLENELRQIIDKTKKDVSEQEINERYGTKFISGCFYAVIFKRDHIARDKKGRRDSGDYQRFISNIKVRNTNKFKEAVFLPGKTNDEEVLIINTDKEDGSAVADAAKEVLHAFSGSNFAKSGYLTACIGRSVTHLSMIDISYVSAASAMKARVCLGVGGVISAEKEERRLIDTKDVIDIRSKKKLAVLFDMLNIKEGCLEISRIFTEAGKLSCENLTILHMSAYEIIDLLFSSMQRKGILVKSGMKKQDVLQQIDDFIKKEEIEAFVCSLLKEFGSVYYEEKHDNGEKFIIEIKKYIAENYMTNINLDDVAKLVCLSPTYVSEVFKRKTGENFSEYLIDYRIEIAKDVLKDIRYKVVDVSLMVGYRDSKYFSRLFKKKVGVNPSDYRKLYL